MLSNSRCYYAEVADYRFACHAAIDCCTCFSLIRVGRARYDGFHAFALIRCHFAASLERRHFTPHASYISAADSYAATMTHDYDVRPMLCHITMPRYAIAAADVAATPPDAIRRHADFTLIAASHADAMPRHAADAFRYATPMPPPFRYAAVSMHDAPVTLCR